MRLFCLKIFPILLFFVQIQQISLQQPLLEKLLTTIYTIFDSLGERTLEDLNCDPFCVNYFRNCDDLNPDSACSDASTRTRCPDLCDQCESCDWALTIQFEQDVQALGALVDRFGVDSSQFVSVVKEDIQEREEKNSILEQEGEGDGEGGSSQRGLFGLLSSALCISDLNCKNEGECDVETGECTCADGFDGKFCVEDTDECAGSPCGANVEKCENIPGGFYCVCKQGYQLDGEEAVDCSLAQNLCEESPEASSKCGQNTICIPSPGSFICECQDKCGMKKVVDAEGVESCEWVHHLTEWTDDDVTDPCSEVCGPGTKVQKRKCTSSKLNPATGDCEVSIAPDATVEMLCGQKLDQLTRLQDCQICTLKDLSIKVSQDEYAGGWLRLLNLVFTKLNVGNCSITPEDLHVGDGQLISLGDFSCPSVALKKGEKLDTVQVNFKGTSFKFESISTQVNGINTRFLNKDKLWFQFNIDPDFPPGKIPDAVFSHTFTVE